ncbi:hypothetical protein J41TS12_19680 [Paenibacillus antibioticophila]|uniref:TolB protein n=1 Tax=Paenibacillus antibioticophila TaxID=1274374 RepID=A0A920CHT2_9BACL|nr:hypothetical protein [Paenibacillus antibioticophila]GIO37107.1 hypothetical protein J41TS12_19680 [Paenibacillus antibioticophila]
MRTIYLKKAVIWIGILAAISACSAAREDSGAAGNDPSPSNQSNNSNHSLEEENNQSDRTGVSAELIQRYEGVELADWVDEHTLIAAKENDSLEPLELEELAGTYPKSLYLLDLDTEQFQLLKEQEGANLGEARLSPDKQHLLYSEYTLGDPAYHVIDLKTKESFAIETEGGHAAMSAHWGDDGTIVGASYRGGAYSSTVQGRATGIDGLTEGPVVIVRKWKGTLFYSTGDNPALVMLDTANGGQAGSTQLEQVQDVLFRREGQELLVVQYLNDGNMMRMGLAGRNGENYRKLAEGTEISGVSISPDQTLVAYQLTESDDPSSKGIYLLDLDTGESVKVGDNIEYATTSWSPSGDKLAYSSWDGEQRNSTIVQVSH